MVAGPEVSRLVSKYESKCGKKYENRKHHEETKSCKKVFLQRVAKLYEVIEEMGSPFGEYSSDLLILHSKDIADPDCHLFSRLFISCQTRECDLREFFQYENQSTPASLSDSGKLYSCQKSQLVDILKNKANMPDSEPSADSIIIDGTAMVNASAPGISKFFDEYSTEDILPKVMFYSSKYRRTDIVFDVYKRDPKEVAVLEEGLLVTIKHQ